MSARNVWFVTVTGWAQGAGAHAGTGVAAEGWVGCTLVRGGDQTGRAGAHAERRGSRASLRWPTVTLPAGPHGWISVSGDEGELTGLANQAPGAIPDFAVLLQETGGDEPGREAAA